jgi:hypothetical protein
MIAPMLISFPNLFATTVGWAKSRRGDAQRTTTSARDFAHAVTRAKYDRVGNGARGRAP